MLHAPLATLLLTAGLLAPDPAPLQATAPADPARTTSVDESARSAVARAHYAARRYREAAQVYEQLWRDTQAPKYRFNAGMARGAAEHDGAAIVHWQAYLADATTIAPAERSMLETEIAAARRRTLPFELKIQGPLAPATLTLRAPEGAPQGPRDPIDLVPARSIDLSLEAGAWTATLLRPGRPDATASFRVATDAESTITLGADAPVITPPPIPIASTPTAPATLTLELGPRRALASGVTVTATGPTHPGPRTLHTETTPWTLPAGAWTLRATAQDRRPAQTTVTLAPGETRRLALQLRPDRATQARLGLGIGLGSAGLVLLTTGAFVTARSSGSLTCIDLATCSASADRVLDRSIGFSLIGAGLGAAVPALTAGLGRKPATDRILMIEAGAGAMLLVGGVAWYFSEVSRTTALDAMPRQHAAATLRGLGGGMLGGALISLVVRRLTRDRPAPVTVVPNISLHTRGLALQARF